MHNVCLCILCSRRIRMWVLYLPLHNAVFGSLFLWADYVSTADHQLVMAPRRAKSGKSKATSKPEVVFDRLRFHTYANEQTFETLIRELYSNLSVDEDICHGHKLTSWIRGVCFTITRDDVSNALYVPIICRPTYPCS